jgi:hypothetical protein
MADLSRSKRQRVETEVSEESLGSESESLSESNGSGESNDEDEDPFRANDMIDLIFVEPDSSDYLVAVPQYTHQLFDDDGHPEEVNFMEEPENCRVSVYIRCSDYRQLVGVPVGAKEGEQAQLLARMQKGIPSDSEVFLLSGNNNPGEDEEADADDGEGDEVYRARIDAFAFEKPSKEDYPQGPAVGPGQFLASFTQNADTFEMYLASAKDPGVSALVRRAESLAMWFIETADGVDFSDERWQVLLLFRRCECRRNAAGRRIPGETLSLSGYVTLFRFNNPFAGSKIRICQALVLPHLQGRGLGREMLLCIYEWVRQQAEVVEITVEDPAPGFQSLRDAVDLEWCYTHLRRPASTDQPALQPDEADAVAKALKLTQAQAEFLVEAETYAAITQQTRTRSSARIRSPVSASVAALVSPVSPESDVQDKDVPHTELLLRPFRLLVKRRLLRTHPELRNLRKQQMQAELEKLYAEQQQRFDRGVKTRARLLARKASSPGKRKVK